MACSSRPQESLLSELPKGSLYWQIAEEARALPSLKDCFQWLKEAGLAWEGHTYRATSESADHKGPLRKGVTRAVPVHRGLGLTPEQVAAAEQRYQHSLAMNGMNREEVQTLIEREYLRPQSKVMGLDPNSLPANHLGFYRYFHVAPHDEWGIYIFADRVLDHVDYLTRSFGRALFAFTPETLMSCVLFEVFQHEFYHHLVECAATVMEMLAAALGKRRGVLLDYSQRAYGEGGAGHPHAPLEEALANAYAYNAFTFATMRRPTFKRLLAKLYQEVLKRRWPGDPAGYRSARHYIGRSHVSGNAQLLAMMLSAADLDPALSLLVGARVMPVGHSAFARKADIPTYLLGDERAVQRIGELVPQPNETYVRLHLPVETTKIDAYVAACEKQARAAKRERRRQKELQRKARPQEPRLPTMGE